MSFSMGTGATRRLFCLFVFASLYFLTVDVLADMRVLELLGEEAVIPVHLIYLLFQCAGFLLFSVLDRFFDARTSGKWPTISLLALSGASLMAFLLIPDTTAVVIAIDLCLLTSGTIGAFAYYHIALGLDGSASLGRFCGFAIATAAVLQILVIAVPLPDLGRAGLLLLSLVAVTLCVLSDDSSPAVLESQASAPHARTATTTRHLVILIAIVAVISFVGGLNDGVLTRMNAESQIDLYALPRLFYLAAAIAAGYVADYRDGRYLGMLVLAAMLCSTVGLLFMDDPVTMFANACVYSLLAGFSIMFFTVPFMRLSVQRNRPALWASMGRAVRLPFLVLGTVAMELLLSGLPFSVTMGLSACMCVLLLLLFFAGGFLSDDDSTRTRTDHEESAPALSDREAMARFCEIRGLTSREQEVLILLYQGCTTAEIADKLFISEKTVRNHISNMMAKADASSRTDLLVRALKEVQS